MERLSTERKKVGLSKSRRKFIVVLRLCLASRHSANAPLQVAALENQLASSIYAASGGNNKAGAVSPFAVPVLGEGGGLLRRSLDSGIKTKTTFRVEEDGVLRGGIVQRQLPPQTHISLLFELPGSCILFLLLHHP